MDNKQEKNKSLFKNIVLFFLASFVPKTISFFMVPLYTHCLTTEQYGNIDLITTTVQLLLPILTLQVQDAILFFSMDRKQNPGEVLSIGLWICMGGFALLIVGTSAMLVSGAVLLEWTYIAFFLLHYFISALANAISYFARAIGKVKSITVSSVITCLITVASNLLFLLVFNWGVNGYLLANILGHLISLVYLCASVRIDQYIVLRISNPGLIKRVILFSLPMVVSGLAWWINNSLDKYILAFFCGASATGLLAVAYKIPTIVSLLGSTVSRAFSVSVLRNFAVKDEDGFLGNSYEMISFLMVLGSSGLMLINIPLSGILFQNSFYAAWQLVPPLLVSATMNHVSLSCQNICMAMGKTKLISSTAMVGAAVNIVLNLCMIPKMGAYGAAVATAVGFFVVWLVRYVWVKKNTELKNNSVREIISYVILWGQMVLAYWGNSFIVIQLVFCLMLPVLYFNEILGISKTILMKIFDRVQKRR